MTRRSDEAAAGPVTGSASPAPSTEDRRRIDRALLRTINLSLVLFIGIELGLAWLLQTDRLSPLDQPIPWWVFALAFAATELAVFDIELKRERATFTFGEIPLVVGLFLSNPLPVLIGRLAGTLVVLVVHDRQMPRKMLLNLTSFGAECVIAFVLFDLVAGSIDVTNPRAWLAALLAVSAADVTSLAVVVAAMLFHGARVSLSRLAFTTVTTAITNTSLAVTALLLLQLGPLALVPLVLIVAIVILAWHSYSGLAARLDSMGLLYDFTRLVAGSQHSGDVVAPLLGRVRELLAAEFAAVHLLDVGAEGASALETWMDASEHQLAAAPTDLERRLAAFDRANPQHHRYNPLERHQALATELGRPDGLAAVLYSDNTIFGVLVVDAHRVDLGPFGLDDAKLFDTLSRHAASSLENAKLIDRLRHENRERLHEARHDPLTGLPNRADFNRRFADMLDEARALGSSLGVGLMDLNKFKQVNDTLGHHIGDLLLAAVAERLRSRLAPEVFLARLGGDEFALLTNQDTDPAALHALGIAIEDAVIEPFELEGLTVTVGASIGFSRKPVDGRDPVTLLRCADEAMYRAKQHDHGHHVEVTGYTHREPVDIEP